MTKKKMLTVALLLVWIGLTLAATFVGFQNGAVYYWNRLLNGGEMAFPCHEITVPHDWTVYEKASRNGRPYYTLRKHNRHLDKYLFVSVIANYDARLLQKDGMRVASSVKVGDEYRDIYELLAVNQNPVRFFSTLGHYPFVIAGEIESIEVFYDDAAELGVTDLKCNGGEG